MDRPPVARRRPPVIALVGIDGAGKTSHAAALSRWLSDRGVPAAHCRNPGGRVALGRLGRRLGRRDAVHLLGRRGFVAAEVTLRGLAIARSLLHARLTGRTAVMDRYTYCQYAAMRARGDRGHRLARVAYALFPQPDLVCFLHVSPPAAHARIVARGTDSEELAYLHALDAAYRALPEAAGFRVVPADGTPTEVLGAIQAAITEALPVPRPRDAGPPPATRGGADTLGWAGDGVDGVGTGEAPRDRQEQAGAAAGPAGRPRRGDAA
ncbi:dTMP kinase [Pilimelia terevasa]|nr:dTMP kinase [Pilimelia terevasa]